MKITETPAASADILADIQAVANAAAAGIPVDPEAARRVRERSSELALYHSPVPRIWRFQVISDLR
jgi:hypothetical protein